MRVSDIPAETAQLAVNTIRFLSIDQVEAAKSGHPGLPMGAADIAYVLFTEFLRFDPGQPDWHGRDRFVLSAGHGSALLYSMLHLYGYDLPLDELKRFRQWGSKTPGHPEYHLTPGVETTTGPLGQGFATGVGMAIAAKHLDSLFHTSSFHPFNYKIYAIVSDGDLMEGISSEAGSLAGHLALDNIVYIYDSNSISIEGSTEMAFSEDVAGRFRSFGWAVTEIDGRDRLAISEALHWAHRQDKPVLILAKTVIGWGSPNKAGTSDAHGAPLGEKEATATRENLGWSYPPFTVPEEVKAHFAQRVSEIAPLRLEWQRSFEYMLSKDEAKAALWKQLSDGDLPEDLEQKLSDSISAVSKAATRNSSGDVMQVIAKLLPGFLGGSADLAPSTMTYLKGFGEFQRGRYDGRNLRFGVREHAMAAVLNGIALSRLLIPFGATFFVFSDYMRNAMRLSALMNLRVIYVLTHDSFYLGEDGPTHQPIEHLAMLRATPNLVVMRPADARETALAWAFALRRTNGPTALVLTRQKLSTLSPDSHPVLAVEKGAYVLHEPQTRQVTLIASGSEVELAVSTAKLLEQHGVSAAVVSMPSYELFFEQSLDYREFVLGSAPRVVLEAGSSFGLHRLAPNGLFITRDDFGASAPAEELARQFGFTPELVAEKVLKYLGK
ncbi:MAG: transketolase [Planctomycetota bacterium]